GFGFRRDVEVLVEAGVRLADLGVSVLDQQPVPLGALAAREVEADDDASIREPVSAEHVAGAPRGAVPPRRPGGRLPARPSPCPAPRGWGPRSAPRPAAPAGWTRGPAPGRGPTAAGCAAASRSGRGLPGRRSPPRQARRRSGSRLRVRTAPRAARRPGAG